jgi:MOSC domain-containing protein YiiM
MAFSISNSPSMAQLLNTLPQIGEVTWIGIRPLRRAPLEVKTEVRVSPEQGLLGDHYAGKYNTNRQVTLIQAEHLLAIASFLGLPNLEPGQLRRNVVVRGLNLLALKDKRFRIGEALLEMTGACHPCSRMEETLGPGGYNAVRGHGGITARVLEGGLIRVGDAVQAV